MRKLLCAGASCATIAAMAVPSAADAKTFTVYAGGPASWSSALTKATGAGVNNFLINKITINVGDTVVWNGKSLAGGFHTVDIPKLHASDLPLIVPTGGLVSGVNDAAGSPFWFNGKLPVLGFNPALFAKIGTSTYDGSTRLDSGLPVNGPHDFVVKFTKAGVYKYFCDVHYGMQGTVVVKPKKAKVPTAKQNAKTLRVEEQYYAKKARQLDKTKVPANQVSLGASAPGGLEVFAMFPSVLKVKAGTTVKFFMSRNTREVHTATFGPASYRNTLAKSFAGPAPSPIALFPSDPPGMVSLGPSTHGNGFANTGALDQDRGTPTIPAFGSIKFTTPGTYDYQCMIHPFMHGTIVVTP